VEFSERGGSSEDVWVRGAHTEIRATNEIDNSATNIAIAMVRRSSGFVADLKSCMTHTKNS
jgi:hypothetical protein